MVVKDFIKKEQYYDSVFLMRIAAKLGEMPGIIQISAGMGTPLNKDTMKELGVLVKRVQRQRERYGGRHRSGK